MAITGQRKTISGYGTSSNQQVLDFSDVLFNPQADGNTDAGLATLLANTKKKSCFNPKFTWAETQLKPTATTTQSTGTGTTIVFDSAYTVYTPAGTILYNPRTQERMIVTSVTNTTTLEATRDFGTYLGGAAALVANDQLQFLGMAYAEGSTSPDAITQVATESYNYTQIFKTAVEVSRTLQKTKLYTGPDENEQIKTKALEHKKDINQAFWMGVRNLTSTTRRTGGVMQIMANASNVNLVDCSSTGIMTIDTLDEASEYAFENDFGGLRYCFAGTRIMSFMDQLFRGYVRIDSKSVESFGLEMMEYKSNKGTLRLVPEPKVFNGYMGRDIIILDISKLAYRFLDGSDTQLQKNIQTNDTDGVKHQFLTEAGLQMSCYGFDNTTGMAFADGNRSPHVRIKGVTSI